MRQIVSLKCYVTLVAALMAVSAMGQAQDFHANIQNETVSRFLSEVTYTSMEDTSRVADYITDATERLDVPVPAVVEVPESYKGYINRGILSVSYCFDKSFSPDETNSVAVHKGQKGALVYDVQPGVECFYRTYAYNIMIGQGTLTTEGPVRMINMPTVRNVRDLGGWTTSDGRTVKYGKLIRGGELNGMHVADAADIEHLKQLGVGAEIDLRADWEDKEYGVRGVSVFGFKSAAEAGAGEVASYLYTNDSGQLLSNMTQYQWLQRWRNEFNFIVQNLRVGRTVYFHCRWGADRTGYLALLLEGLLGVTYDGLVKDYELTSFASHDKKKEGIDPVIAFIESLAGETLQEKFITFWTKRVGVKQQDIDYFIDEMLDGEKPGSDIGTAITSVSYSPVSTTYNLLGRRVVGRQHGFVLHRQQDGSVRKVVR